jgi:hypothetical protein
MMPTKTDHPNADEGWTDSQNSQANQFKRSNAGPLDTKFSSLLNG